MDSRQEGHDSGRRVRDVDPDTETVFVDRTKDEIKDSPEYDEDRFNDQAYRDRLGTYYGYR